jgi:peptide chain release factor 2
LRNSGAIFDLERKKTRIETLQKRTEAPDFWNDQQTAQSVLREINSHTKVIERWQNLKGEIEDLAVLEQLATEEEDQESLREVADKQVSVEESLRAFELEATLSEEDDMKDALLTIHSGAGGTESQDWAEMLLRMYLRWAENRGYSAGVLETLPGEEAGVKNATVEIKGDYAYGYLKSEVGVHRLVRISPFDFNQRRHTSFASVFVIPEVEDNITIEIKDDDLRIDTFRASGAGGQHVNKTSSAVRIVHHPTGIVATCQSERSQHKNRDYAMKILKSKLYQHYKELEAEKQAKLEDSKKKIEWGSQIRSYVFHPYTMVKDHRTGYETSNAKAVIDGGLDEFIKAYLVWNKSR